MNAMEVPQELSGFEGARHRQLRQRGRSLRRRGYLPAYFKEGTHYTLSHHTNEQQKDVTSAEILTSPDGKTALQNGLVALAAMLADRRDRVVQAAGQILGKDVVSKWGETEINYLTYMAFNAGQGCVVKYLQNMKKQGGSMNPVRVYTGKDYNGSSTDARYNTTLRIASWDYLRKIGIFQE